MKKLSIFLGCVIALCGGTSAAEKQWFCGNVGGTATGGSWASLPAEGVQLTDSKYVLDEPESPFVFTATEEKCADVYTNLIVRTTVKFGSAYVDSDPEIPLDEVMGVAVCQHRDSAATYYVLNNSNGGTAWVDTGIVADLDSLVEVCVIVTKDRDGYKAEYSFGNSTKSVVVNGGEIQNVSYSGSGEVSALNGAYQENWIPPSGEPIPSEAQEAVEQWAKENGVKVEDFNRATRDPTSGRTKYESCMLNLAPNAKLVATQYCTKAGATLGVAVKPPLTGAESKVSYKLLKNGKPEGEAQTNGAFEVTLGTGRAVYSVQALVDGAAAGNPSSKVGAQSVTVAEAGSYLPVPWTDNQGNDAKVTDLIKVSGLKKDDQIDVYDAESGKWTTCVYDGSAWAVATGTDQSTPANQTIPTVKRGQAFRFSSSTGGTLYLIGGAEGEVTSTDVVADKFTLVAKPDGTAFELSKLGTLDKAMVMEQKTGLPTATYINFYGTWVKKTTGGKAEDAGWIPANTGFFLKTSTGKVNW